MTHIGHILGTVLFHIPPVRLLDWLDIHLPGFNQGYEHAYNRWAYKQNSKNNDT